MLTLNAEGKTGSEAVDFVKDSISKSENANEHELKILIDRPDQSEGITKFLTSEGFTVLLEDDDGVMFLLASKPRSEDNDSDSESELEPEPESDSDIKIQDLIIPDKADAQPQIKREVIKHTVIKDSAAVILSYENRKYMPEFTAKIIDSLNKAKIKPDVIVLMNNAVSLAAYNSQVCAELKELESDGVEILISESCADRMGVTEALGAGVLTEMSEIFEKIFSCKKVISL
ncbi:MAG: hypothetical protein IJP48_00720 [Synergistaceae bacterium]|nr:hypothetical protein [Synergistaceae bacterium]